MNDPLSICVCTRFYPSVGGIETLAEELADQWTASGHRVMILTDVPVSAGPLRSFPYEVLHRPSALQLFRSFLECDVFVHNNISLKAIWPLAAAQRPFVAVHHGRYFSSAGNPDLRARLKLRIARSATCNVSVSNSVQEHVGTGGIVIPNLYPSARFHELPETRDKQLVFVGRLVSDKGVHVLLNAMVRLRSVSVVPRLTIVGDGPERPRLETIVRDNALSAQVTFLGAVTHKELPIILNQHRIIVVPSLVEEGFGIVALEGIACGLVAVGTAGGGLPDAIGPCGETFPPGDHKRLADLLARLLSDQNATARYREAAPCHLAHHSPTVIANRYLACFHQLRLAKRALTPCES